MSRGILVILMLNFFAIYGMELEDILIDFVDLMPEKENKQSELLKQLPDYFNGYTQQALDNSGYEVEIPVFCKQKTAVLLLKEEIQKLAQAVQENECNDGCEQYRFVGKMLNDIKNLSHVSDALTKDMITKGNFVVSTQTIPIKTSSTEYLFMPFVVANSTNNDDSKVLFRRFVRDFICQAIKYDIKQAFHPYNKVGVFKEEKGYFNVQGTIQETLIKYKEHFATGNYSICEQPITHHDTLYRGSEVNKQPFVILVGTASQDHKKAQKLSSFLWGWVNNKQEK